MAQIPVDPVGPDHEAIRRKKTRGLARQGQTPGQQGDQYPSQDRQPPPHRTPMRATQPAQDAKGAGAHLT